MCITSNGFAAVLYFVVVLILNKYSGQKNWKEGASHH